MLKRPGGCQSRPTPAGFCPGVNYIFTRSLRHSEANVISCQPTFWVVKSVGCLPGALAAHPSTPPITHRGTTRSHPRLLTQNLVEHQAFNNKCASRPLAHVDALWAGRGSVPAAAMISGAGAQQAHPPNAHRSGGVHATVFYQATLTMQAVKEATLQRTVESYCM